MPDDLGSGEADAGARGVRRLKARWNGAPAECLLIGDGPGPRGEAVMVVGFDRGSEGFAVAFLKSWEPGKGHAEAACRTLAASYGRLVAICRPERAGRAFWLRMSAKGVLVAVEAL